MKKIIPFSEEQSQIDDMDVDNSFDRIVLEGELVVTRSEEGLEKIRNLLCFLKATEDILCDDLERGVLPKNEKIIPPVSKNNPFE